MSVHGPKKTTIGVTRSGRPHRGAFVSTDHPRALVAHPHAMPKIESGMRDVTNVHADLGKTAKPKRAHLEAPPIHAAMVAKSRKDGSHFGGLSGQDLSRYDADPASLNTTDPLAGPPQGKRLSPVMAKPGMRSRTSASDTATLQDLGARVIATALSRSEPDHPAKLGISTLLNSTSED